MIVRWNNDNFKTMTIKNGLFIYFALLPVLLSAQFQNFADSFSRLSIIADKGDMK